MTERLILEVPLIGGPLGGGVAPTSLLGIREGRLIIPVSRTDAGELSPRDPVFYYEITDVGWEYRGLGLAKDYGWTKKCQSDPTRRSWE